MVAGISARYALEKRTERQFLKESVDKILAPSTLGVLAFGWLGGYVIYLHTARGNMPESVPAFVRVIIILCCGIGALWFCHVLFVAALFLLLIRKIAGKCNAAYHVLPEQEKPDGNFPTVAYPNPESPKAFELALKLAKEVDADIVLATDPDADRLGVYCKDTKSGEYVTFTGNMSGMLIAEYILREKTAMGTMPKNPALVETIVTTDMAKAIAKSYGVKLIEVLTGFKYIGEQIKFFEQQNTYNYVFGLEESYGCLAGTYARDKDACVAVMMLCEVASWCKKNNMTLWDEMLAMYEKYGYYREGLETKTLKGIDGAAQIQELMSNSRKNPPKRLGGFDVLAVRDYKEDTRKDTVTGEVTKTGLPESNVLYYELSDNAWCCMRPSGTEPKIKYYFGVKGSSLEDAEKKLAGLKEDLLK